MKNGLHAILNTRFLALALGVSSLVACIGCGSRAHSTLIPAARDENIVALCDPNEIVQKVNGHITATVVDNYPARRKKGFIALQLLQALQRRPVL